MDLVKKAGQAKGLYIPVEAVNNNNDKIARIQSLRPRMKNGSLQFSKKHRQLLDEVRYFPKGKNDDGLDALELAVRMSNDNGVSFGFAGGESYPRDPDERVWLGQYGRRFHG